MGKTFKDNKQIKRDLFETRVQERSQKNQSYEYSSKKRSKQSRTESRMYWED